MSRHLKSLAAPKTWRIPRKTSVWIVKPLPGMYKLEHSIALSTLLKSIGYAKTTREVKFILNNNKVFVDGKRRKDYKFAIGLFNVLSFPDIDEHYRIIFKNKKLAAVKIKADEADKKISKIKSKREVKGKVQLNLLDGRNILVDKEKNKEFSIGDSVLFTLPDQKIKETLKLEQGNYVYVYDGKHIGEHGRIEEIKEKLVRIKTKNKTIETKKDYVIVVGKDEPLITIS